MTLDVAHPEQGELVAAPPPDPVTTALAEVSKTNTSITEHFDRAREIAERHRNVVADVKTTKGYEQIAAIRTELREAGRYPIQKLKDAGSKMLGTMQRQFNARCEQIIEELKGLEAPFQQQLDAEDARKAEEKAERERKEAERKDGHLQAIAAIARMPADAAGLDSAELAQRIQAAQGMIVDDSYEEFQGQALQAREEAIQALNGMLIAAQADEQERRELEEARARLAEQTAREAAARQAAEEQAAAERARAEAAEREAAELREQLAAANRREEEQAEERRLAAEARTAAIAGRIDAMRELVAKYAGDDEPSVMLKMVLDELGSKVPDVEHYGDRLQEALEVRISVLATLNSLHTKALEREAEEVRASRAALVDSRIAVFDNIGQPDFASSTLRITLAALETVHLKPEDYDDRHLEALQALTDAKDTLRRWIADAEAREEREREAEREREEEAERERRAEAQRAEHRALADAKRAHGEELYDMVLRMLPFVALPEHHETDRRARDLLLKINPKESFDA